MTEYQAKERWCPMVRIPPDAVKYDGPAVNVKKGSDNKCIASDCMMWRIDEGHYVSHELGGYDVPGKGGYCGLGGKP